MVTHESKLNSASSPADQRHFPHLVFLVIGYGLIAFIAVGSLDVSALETRIPLIYAVAVATVIEVAIWSALGPGTYLQRLCYAHLVGLIVAAGFGFGYLAANLSMATTHSATTIASVSLTMLVSLPLLTMVAQIPFWILRAVFGIQLVHRSQRPGPTISLRDMFVITCAFALAISGLQLAMALSKSNLREQLGHITSYAVPQADGSYDWQDMPIEDAVARAKAEREFMSISQSANLREHLGMAMVVLVVSCGCVPILILFFGSKQIATGCLWTTVYSVGVILVVILAYRVGTGALPRQVAMIVGQSMGLTALGVSIPLVVSRSQGFRLTSRRQFDAVL